MKNLPKKERCPKCQITLVNGKPYWISEETHKKFCEVWANKLRLDNSN